MQFSSLRAVDDIDELFPETPDWETDVKQMSRGALGYRETILSLPGVEISWEYLAQKIRSYQWMQKTGFFMGMACDAQVLPVWKGNEVSPKQVLVFGNGEQDVILYPGTRVLNVYIAPELAEPAGLMHVAPGLWNTHPFALRRFIDVCRRETKGLGQTRQATLLEKARSIRLADWITETVPTVLDSPTGIMPGNSYKIFRRAEAILEAEGWCEARHIDDMAKALDVPRRSLHRAFKDWSGLGPKGYIRLVQLHNFRRNLKTLQQESSVTAAAIDAGFDHLGRAARYYQEHFGELPRQTRERQSTSALAS
ncbi:MAG: helix-turn-helix domain-containing protein [Mangrovicoccus sp.]|nr:helix-turn-helix domain-containing protein [Mangrovicoccus sp.]